MTSEEAMKAAKDLRDYCREIGECAYCIFGVNDLHSCILCKLRKNYPLTWEVEE